LRDEEKLREYDKERRRREVKEIKANGRKPRKAERKEKEGCSRRKEKIGEG
jgi:hypothetical protein